ncbi:MAG TPA: NUDIX hydrolase [Patescibacteria group bacterium]|nr:NUDIX hydrolase [Patescibacteria group bacterium]
MNAKSELSQGEVQKTAALLSKLEPGYLPQPIFDQVCRVMTVATLQIIPFRVAANGTLEVLLIPREGDALFWPGMWHNPGTMVRATDTLESAMKRLLNDEMGGITVETPPVFAESRLHTCDRGKEMLQIYWAKVKGTPKVGEFFKVNDLPKNIVWSEAEVVNRAVEIYGHQPKN